MGPAASHSAPGTSAAFDYQFERALSWLSKSPSGFVVGIETHDDVAVVGPEGPALLEQDKHSIASHAQPFGDRSRDLWNTLNIWMDALEKDGIPESARFLMATNKVVAPTCVAYAIGLATTDAAVAACIVDLENAAVDPPDHIAPLTTRVLRMESRKALASVLKRCELADGSQASAGPSLRLETIANMQLPSWHVANADSVLDELLGWLHKISLAKWQAGLPAWIYRDQFVNQFHAILDRRRREKSRERAEHLIPVTDQKVGEVKSSIFVKQIYLVTEDTDVADTAIREFIRCSIEKTRLSEEGNITDDDWKTFESSLFNRWKKIRSRVVRMSQSALEEEMGFEILTDTTEDFRQPLAGSATDEVYLTSGSYHRLADMLQIGWHPRFDQLLDGPSSKK
jgi:hypothetical protein